MKKYDRREALAKFAGIGAGVAGLGLCAGCPGGSTYGREEPLRAGGKLENLELLKDDIGAYTAREIVIGGRAAFIYRGDRNDEEWYAVDARCTHSGCKIGFNRETREFVCPCHGSRFAPNGERLSGPARRPLKTYEVLLRERYVVIIPDRGETGGQPG